MTKAALCLGKLGDLINILPLLYSEYQKTGERQRLVVSRQYASLVSGLSYVEPVIYPGSWEDLDGALRFSKELFSRVESLCIYGNGFPAQHRTPSFLMEPWERVGKLALFDQLPLVIDGRSEDRETALVQQHVRKMPFILFADHGESSPFPDKEELARLLHDVAGSHCQIIRLSEVRATHFFDLLALFERASLIVSTETAHLHLARAVNVPVIAFTQDKPSRWHGSPQSSRYSLLCRYGDFELRRNEIIRAIQHPTGRIPTVPMITRRPFAYNPTTLTGFPGMIYRFHPTKSWRTQLVYQEGNSELPLTFPDQFEGMSMEDARLFWFRGKPHVSFVAARQEFGMTNAVTGYGELCLTNDSASVPKVFIPEFGMNSWGGVEKNWLFFAGPDGKLFCIYACDSEQIVVEVEGNRVRNIMRTEPLHWPWGKIRGGCMIAWQGRFLRFFHSHTTEGHRDGWIYNIGALTMEAQPPFRMLQISKSPIISGDERLNLHCRHWKQNVVFPAGVKIEANYFMLAYGYNDCESRMAALTEGDLNL